MDKFWCVHGALQFVLEIHQKSSLLVNNARVRIFKNVKWHWENVEISGKHPKPQTPKTKLKIFSKNKEPAKFIQKCLPPWFSTETRSIPIYWSLCVLIQFFSKFPNSTKISAPLAPQFADSVPPRRRRLLLGRDWRRHAHRHVREGERRLHRHRRQGQRRGSGFGVYLEEFGFNFPIK